MERGRRPVGENRALAARQNRGHPMAFAAQEPVDEELGRVRMDRVLRHAEEPVEDQRGIGRHGLGEREPFGALQVGLPGLQVDVLCVRGDSLDEHPGDKMRRLVDLERGADLPADG